MKFDLIELLTQLKMGFEVRARECTLGTWLGIIYTTAALGQLSFTVVAIYMAE